MRNTESNSVFVVALGASPFKGWPSHITPINVVEKWSRYFFPASGKNWPKAPPNYVGFRYQGRLQSIHHVEEYTIFQNWHEVVDEWPNIDGEPHFLLTLGPPIRPTREVRTGRGIVRAARVWVDIDLLLTAATITEASQLTRARRVIAG